MSHVYDRIGRRYADGRRTDPRWMAALEDALGSAASIVNVGAGTGSYEPPDRDVVAIEPSEVMLAQRGSSAAPAVRAVAERLPFADGSFDVAMAILTIHHWQDIAQGLGELRRVAARQIVLTFDPRSAPKFWVTRDYFPVVTELDRSRVPSLDVVAEHLPGCDVRPLPVPRDMQDAVLAAHWARPEAYLDPAVRANASGFAQADPRLVQQGVEQLRRDLQDGTWACRNRDLLDQEEYDAGYRLLVSG